MLADARSQSSLGKGMKKVICNFTWSPGEESQAILDGCSRVKWAWGVLRGGEEAQGGLVSLSRAGLHCPCLLLHVEGQQLPPSSNCVSSLSLGSPCLPISHRPAAACTHCCK